MMNGGLVGVGIHNSRQRDIAQALGILLTCPRCLQYSVGQYLVNDGGLVSVECLTGGLIRLAHDTCRRIVEVISKTIEWKNRLGLTPQPAGKLRYENSGPVSR